MPPKPGRRPSSQLRPVLAAVAVTLVCGWLLRSRSGKSSAYTSEDRKEVPAADKSPWPRVRTIRDLETLWEVPKEPKGVLFVAHGCSHQGSDFWPPSTRCIHCLGLPEEVLVREKALKRGYAVIAVTSFNRDSKCWHNTQPKRSEDLKRLPSILREVMLEEGLEQLPLFAFGASSGGSQVLRLAAIMPEVKGVISQITPVNSATLAVEGGGDRRYPPVLFVHMAQRDPKKAENVTAAIKILKKAGTPAAEIRVAPQPVTPALLQRSPQISAQLAKKIVAAMKEGGALDKEGFLQQEPRPAASPWRQLVQPVVGDLSLEADVSHLTELLNVAYARHEIVSEHTDASLAWLEARGKKSIDSLL